MAEPRIVFLMYHELELPDRPLCQSDPGYVRYVVPAVDFKRQMQALQSLGWRGISTGAALNFPVSSAVAITFDDGCETDLDTAAPVLRDLGFGATFYITAGFVGRRGYLSPQQLRELAAMGFEIGCHSMSHPCLTDIDDAALRRETTDAKIQLEQIVGKPVEHFSCPGGGYNRRIVEMAQRAGFRSVANSRARANFSSRDAFALGRIAVLRGTSLPSFTKICGGDGLWKLNLRGAARNAAKRTFGNRIYDQVRALLLHKKTTD